MKTLTTAALLLVFALAAGSPDLAFAQTDLGESGEGGAILLFPMCDGNAFGDDEDASAGFGSSNEDGISADVSIEAP